MAEEIINGMIPMGGEDIKPDLGPESAPENGDYQGLVDHCMKLYDRFKDSPYRLEKIEEIKKSRSVYEQKENPATANWPFDNAANITLPLDTITVDNLEPRVFSGLLGGTPKVRFEMEGVTEQDDITKALEYWFNQQLDCKIKIENKTIGIVHTILTEGTYFGIPEYDREEIVKRNFVFDPQTGQIVIGQDGKPVVEDYVDTVYEGGKIENIAFTDILCADDLGTPEEWERADKIRLVYPTYADLMRSKNMTGFLPDRIGPWLVSTKGDLKKSDAATSPSQEISGVKITGKEIIECAEFYISYPINKDEDAPATEQDDFNEERLLVTVHLKSKTILRIALLRDLVFSNECPIKRVRLFAEEGRSFGTSIYGKIKSIQDGASDFFNAILNIAYIVMLPWFFYDDTAGMRGKIKVTPGEGVPVSSVKGVLFPNFNINPASYLKFIDMFIGLWERLGSVANPQIGRPDDAKKTATEIMTVVQEGNIKFNYQAKTTKEEFITILRYFYDLYYQHMPHNATFNFNGQQVPFPRAMMRRNIKFHLTGSTEMANKMIQRKEAEDLYMMSRSDPLLDPLTAIEEVLKSRDKVDLNRYINPDIRGVVTAFVQNPEVGQVIQKYLQTKEQTAQEMEGGINGGASQA